MKYYFLLTTFFISYTFNCLATTPERTANKLPVDQVNALPNDALRLQVLDSILNSLAVSQIDNRETYYDSLRKSDIHFSNEVNKGNFYIKLTSYYSYLGKYKIGNELTLKAVEIFEKSNSRPQLAKAYYVLGLIHNKLNNLDQSLDYLIESLKIQEELPPSISQAHGYNALGGVYDLLERNEKAYEYYQKALSGFKQHKDLHSEGLVYNNLGLLMQRQNEHEQALKFMLQAQEILDKEGVIRVQTSVASNIASTYIDLGQYKKAEKVYLAAKEKLIQHKDQNTLAIVNSGLGSLYTKTGKLDKAEALLRESIPLLQPVNAMRVYSNLASIDTLQKDYVAFAKDYTQYVALKDSIYNEEKMLKISELEKKYETRLKDKEIELLQKDNALKEKQLYFMVIAVIAVVLLLLVLFFRFRVLMQQKKLNLLKIEKHEIEKLRLEESYYAEQKIRELQKAKYRNDLDEKNRELASASLYLLNKNQVLQQVKETIQDVIREERPSYELKPVIKQISGNLTMDEDWEQFKIQFEQVNPDFFTKLNEHYDQLTDNDIRFLAYMRINLSTKEIAQMLNISTKSANMTRYRIRKKVGLNKEEDLMDFVRKI
ncbi:tetratricopeptide repeat protein [Limibacter armeniacum]|uniref:tetratricopeptide repeat protein n=1 Tax=Limibacter armeniacum TaxID=466084 RepID=UPI002FE52606